MSPRMVNEFIRFELARYQEPSRRGTPRGAKIGFGRSKFASTLHLLNSADIKSVAANLNVSVGLLRKWKTEKDFNVQIERNAEEFLDDIVGILREQTKKDAKAFEKFLNTPFKRNERVPASGKLDNILADVPNWGRPIIRALEQRCQVMGNEAFDALDNLKFVLYCKLGDLYDAALRPHGKKTGFKPMMEKSQNIFIYAQIRGMIERLQEGDLTLRDRKVMVSQLRQLAKKLEPQ